MLQFFNKCVLMRPENENSIFTHDIQFSTVSILPLNVNSQHGYMVRELSKLSKISIRLVMRNSRNAYTISIFLSMKINFAAVECSDRLSTCEMKREISFFSQFFVYSFFSSFGEGGEFLHQRRAGECRETQQNTRDPKLSPIPKTQLFYNTVDCQNRNFEAWRAILTLHIFSIWLTFHFKPGRVLTLFTSVLASPSLSLCLSHGDGPSLFWDTRSPSLLYGFTAAIKQSFAPEILQFLIFLSNLSRETQGGIDFMTAHNKCRKTCP